jgi:uncharacterized DUF497 family protein
MEFEYDDHKANLNLARHGVDFADAVRIFSAQESIVSVHLEADCSA